MITIPSVVERIIKTSPLIQEGLARELINTSALARMIRPKVALETKKDVSEAAIIMAIKRLQEDMSHHIKPVELTIDTPDIIIRSNLVELTYQNSLTLNKKQQKLLSLIADYRNQYFLTITTGVFETTIIASAALETAILKILNEESLTAESKQLSSITVILSKLMIENTGTIAQILRQLAWENINVIEVVSTYQELTIIVSSSDTNRALATLRQP